MYTGRRPWRWSFIAYIAARTLSFGATVAIIVGLSFTTEINCAVRFLVVCSQRDVHTHHHPAQLWYRSIIVRLIDYSLFYIDVDRYLPGLGLAFGACCHVSACAPSVSGLPSHFHVK